MYSDEGEEKGWPAKDALLSERQRNSDGWQHTKNLIFLCSGFVGLFLAFAFTQNLTSSLVTGKLGYWSLAVIYIFFALSSLFIAAPFVARFTPKWSMFIGSAMYLGFILAMIDPVWYILLPASAFVGLGAGLLWIGQGAYLAYLSANYAADNLLPAKATMGHFNGIFFASNQITFSISNALGGVILSAGNVDDPTTKYVLFLTLFVLGVIGVAMFIALKHEENINSQAQQSQPPSPPTQEGKVRAYVPDRVLEESMGVYEGDSQREGGKKGTIEFVVATLVMPGDPKMGLLLVLMIFLGMEQGFMVGDFTSEIITPTKGAEWIGWVFFLIAVTNGTSSLLLGKVCDRWGKKIVLLVGFLANFGFSVVFFFFIFSGADYLAIIQEQWEILFIGGVVLGIGDAVWNTILPIILSTFFTEQSEMAFANLRFWQSMGYVIVFGWGPFLDFEMKCAILAAVLVVAMGCVVVLHTTIISIDYTGSSPSKEEEEDEGVALLGSKLAK